METNNCTGNQAQHDGSGQTHRYLDALHPENIPVDDRSIEDLLVFAKHYASLLRFYSLDERAEKQGQTNESNEQNKNYESWKEFFYADISVVIASIKVFGKKLWHVKQEYENKHAQLDANPVKQNLRELVIANVHHLQRINRWYRHINEDHPLRYELEVKIRSVLAPALKSIIAYDKGAPGNLYEESEIETYYGEFKQEPWNCIYKNIKSDNAIYLVTSEGYDIKHAALYFDNVFQEIFKVYKQLYDRTNELLNDSFNNFPEHNPHMALFICFLELFSQAQTEINTLTQKHLDFYYRDVLQLKEHPAQPDSVYLIYELAKELNSYDLETGTSLTAGKDATGKELIYKTDKDLAINNAIVKELKTIFIDKVWHTDIIGLDTVPKSDYLVEKIFASPVANSADGLGGKFTQSENAWPSSGYFDTKTDQPLFIGEEASIGFAIASPQLFLAEGDRRIEIILSGTAGTQEWISGFEKQLSFNVYITGEKGWIVKENIHFEFTDLTSFLGYSGKFSIDIDAVDPPIIPFNPNQHEGNFITNNPVVKIILNNEPIEFIYDRSDLANPKKTTRFAHEWLRETKVFEIAINVIVGNIGVHSGSGMTVTNVFENDNGPIEVKKPFPFFGVSPQVGSSFRISTRELIQKKIDSCIVEVNWMGLPADFVDYYKLYQSDSNTAGGGAKAIIQSNDDFVVRYGIKSKGVYKFVQMDDGGTKVDDKIALFGDGEGVINNPQSLQLSLATLYSELQLKDVALYNKEYDLEIVLELLTPGFLTELFQKIIFKQALATKGQAVNPPYIPQVKSITIHYNSVHPFLQDVDQFFHLYPFGNSEIYFKDFIKAQSIIDPAKVKKFIDADKAAGQLIINSQYLLPQFKFGSDSIERAIIRQMNEASPDTLKNYFKLNQYSSLSTQQGNLYIGIEDLLPPQNLSLLFKIADGTAADNENDPFPVNWSYLVNNEWIALPDVNVISDSTYGLQTTGIILIDFPADATNNNTIITGGLHWLCISVEKTADRYPKIIDVIAQAGSATFFDLSNADPLQQNDPEHYRNPLPAGSISKMLNKAAEVSAVIQPFESFDNKMREEGAVFYTRVSERLRHKARAITRWDYEHIVLENFPEVYKVKCIMHSDPDCSCRTHGSGADKKCCCDEIAPGHVLIVPISNLRNKKSVNNFRPRIGRRILKKMQEYLIKRASPFVRLQARNPKFEEIKVAFQVQFKSGIDKGLYLNKLNQDIIRHLTPWAFDASSEIAFDNKVYASTVINFIEERSYVDFISNFKMIHIVKDCCTENQLDDLSDDNFRNLAATANPKRNEVIIETHSQYGILVSVKQHLIDLYPEEITDDPCKNK